MEPTRALPPRGRKGRGAAAAPGRWQPIFVSLSLQTARLYRKKSPGGSWARRGNGCSREMMIISALLRSFLKKILLLLFSSVRGGGGAGKADGIRSYEIPGAGKSPFRS